MCAKIERVMGPTLVGVVIFLATSLMACSSPATAPAETETRPAESASESPPGTIPPAEAAEYISEKGTVCGTVTGTRFGRDAKLIDATGADRGGGGEANLDFGPPFPAHSFSITILVHLKKNFPGLEEGIYNGKDVCVTGYIDQFFDGVPFIRAEKPENIEESAD